MSENRDEESAARDRRMTLPVVALVGPFPPWRSGIADQDARLLAALRRLGVEPLAVGFSRMYPRWLYPGVSPKGKETEDFSEGEESWGRAGRGGQRELRITAAQGATARAAGDSRATPPASRPLLEEISSSSSPSPWPSLLDGLNPYSFVRAARYLSFNEISLVILPWWTSYFAPHAALLLSTLGALRPSAVRLLLCHNVFDHEQNPLKNALTRAVLKRADRFVAQNARSAAEILSERPDARVDVIPHPSEPRAVIPDRAAARARLGVPPDAPLFLFSGILRPYKGWDVLLEAFAAARREIPEAQLVLAGEAWGAARRLRDLAPAGARLELRYLPEDERALWFAACDAVVCPYRHATGSGIAADALAFSRPVIGSAVDGLLEIIEEGRSGLLVPPGDADALAAAMVRFVREGLGPRLSAGAAHRRAAFTPETHARRVLAAGGIGV
jgi:glycosyltransferase involved in cell wall biosynthesis